MQDPRTASVGVAALLAAALVALAGGAAPARAGVEVAGRVRLAIEGMPVSEVGPIVVYLESIGGGASGTATASGLEIRQHNAAFSPGFLAVGQGTTVRMPNDDAIYHNVFSYSKGNRFDLGLYPAGESRSVAFETPGVVKMYCSIHESMSATVFVAPTPLFAKARSDGAFRIGDVPPGRYRVRTWCERLPDTSREITVGAGGVRDLEIDLGGDALR